MKRVLFFFPHMPYPPRTGAHKRCVELLYGLRDLGCDVLLASSEFTSDTPWTPAGIATICEEFGCNVSVHSPGLLEAWSSRYCNNLKNRLLPRRFFMSAVSSLLMKSWFTRIAQDFKPDVLFMNYAFFDAIVDYKATDFQMSIIEMHDLVTLNQKMQATLKKVLGKKEVAQSNIPVEALDLDFFREKSLTADPAEYRIYDRYDVTLCISASERTLVQENTHHTRAVYLPMTQPVSCLDNSYEEDALFTVGPNLFNVQGFYFFLDKVLPLIQIRQPDFQLKVTGNFFCNKTPRIASGVSYLGFVDDLNKLYQTTRFFICPVYGGTGQQVKIVEAMAQGLAVVALEHAALRSPLRHGENGLVARSAEEFANHVLRLWNDRALCRSLGEEARNTVAAECSRELLVESLTSLFGQTQRPP